MVDIVNGKDVYFEKHKFKEQDLRARFESFIFSSNRPVTKSMLAWWAYQHPNQKLLDCSLPLQIEHIYARNRAGKEPLKEEAMLELLGNKSLLETNINIRASDYRFIDKRKYFDGEASSDRGAKDGSQIAELRELARSQTSFEEKDITARNKLIIDTFMKQLKSLSLMA